jgi:hypothetical protein
LTTGNDYVATFDVVYRVSEYRQFVFEYVREVKGAAPGFVGRILISAMAVVVFAVKKSKMPLCSFSIDPSGIRRRTASGEYFVPWKRVKRALRYAPGYLFELDRGAMPVPYRCLSDDQRALLDRLIQNHEATIAVNGYGGVSGSMSREPSRPRVRVAVATSVIAGGIFLGTIVPFEIYVLRGNPAFWLLGIAATILLGLGFIALGTYLALSRRLK